VHHPHRESLDYGASGAWCVWVAVENGGGGAGGTVPADESAAEPIHRRRSLFREPGRAEMIGDGGVVSIRCQFRNAVWTGSTSSTQTSKIPTLGRKRVSLGFSPGRRFLTVRTVLGRQITTSLPAAQLNLPFFVASHREPIISSSVCPLSSLAKPRSLLHHALSSLL
jgi:hypothetical protein